MRYGCASGFLVYGIGGEGGDVMEKWRDAGQWLALWSTPFYDGGVRVRALEMWRWWWNVLQCAIKLGAVMLVSGMLRGLYRWKGLVWRH